MNPTKRFSELFVGLTISSAIILLTFPGMDSAYSQSSTTASAPMTTNNTTTSQQHAAHTFDNLTISEHIPLTGQLTSGDYILLIDFTPFSTSIEGHSHIAVVMQ